MLRIRQILFPVDFSERCVAASGAVHALANRTGATITLLHAVSDPRTWLRPPHSESLQKLLQQEDFGFLASRMRAEGLEKLRHFQPELLMSGRYRHVVELGEADIVLRDYIEASHPDLVMIPTQGHGAFRRFLTGSITNRLLHDVKCPIWTDAHLDKPHSGLRDVCDHVYCAVDLVDPEYDLRLIRWAVDYAKIWNAEVHLLHASPGAIHNPGQPDEPFALTLLNWARQSLANLQNSAGTNFDVIVEAESPATLVRSSVREPRTSVVVIGRGRHGDLLGRLGSQAYSIIRGSACPVISI